MFVHLSDDELRQVIRETSSISLKTRLDQLLNRDQAVYDAFAKGAQKIFGYHDIDYDEDPTISQGDDGAYVLAWLWVPNEEVGL